MYSLMMKNEGVITVIGKIRGTENKDREEVYHIDGLNL